MAKRRKTTTVFIAITLRGWARAATEAKAVGALKDEYGAPALKLDGWTLYEVEPRTQVDPLGHAMIYQRGFPPKHVKTVEGKRPAFKEVKPAKRAAKSQNATEQPKRGALEAALADPFAAAAELEVAAANARIKKTHQKQIMDIDSDAAH